MLRYYYINRGWMISTSARRVYYCAAILSLLLFFLLFTVHLTGTVPSALLPILKPLLFAGVLGAATTLVAMEYFLFGFDNSATLKKLFWFCLMLVPPLGPPLYYFFVYSRSDLHKRQNKRDLRSQDNF
jgi:hypothetical protein